MNSDKVCLAAKQLHYPVFAQPGWNIGREFVKRRIIPIAEVTYKFVLLRILMDVYDQAQEIGFAIHGDSLERTFKQRPCSLNSNT